MKKYKVTVDGQEFTVSVEELASSESSPAGIKISHLSDAGADLPPKRETPSEQNKPADGATGIKVAAPMPGSIIALAVKAGESVKEGDVLLVLEAMKMENEITAPRPGVIGTVHVSVGETVSSGDPLLEIV